MKILAIIPARSGSKGIPDKNIQIYNGLPLLVHSIRHAQMSRFKLRTIVSTDSELYAKIAIEAGAEAPFLRPESISGDLSTDLEVFRHTLEWLDQNQDYRPDIVVHLRPTYPTRGDHLLDIAIQMFIQSLEKGYTSLRSVVEMEKSAFKMYTITEETLVPLFTRCNMLGYTEIKEPFNQCRQILPTCYLHNGCIDIFKPEIIKNDTVSGDKILPFVMSKSEIHDIDTVEDLKKLKHVFISIDGRKN